MALYEFECDCGNKVEVIQKVKDPPPSCRICSKDMKKYISRTSFILKGEGWFRDGYSKRPNK